MRMGKTWIKQELSAEATQRPASMAGGALGCFGPRLTLQQGIEALQLLHGEPACIHTSQAATHRCAFPSPEPATLLQPPPDLSRCLHLLPRGHRTLANDLRRVQVRYDRLYPCPRVFQAGTCGRPWCQSGKTRPYRVTSAGAPRLLSLHLTEPPPTRLVRLPRVSSAHTAPTEPSGG